MSSYFAYTIERDILNAVAPKAQRLLRKKSKYPRQERVFDQKLILGITFGLMGAVLVLVTIVVTPPYLQGDPSVTTSGYAVLLGLTLFCIFMVYYAFVRRFGVDEEKVWTKFGPFYYREVRFDQVDDLSSAKQMFVLSGGGQKLNMQYNRFEYTLAYIRLLEELNRRPFALDGVQPTDERWPAYARDWRIALYQEIVGAQHRYYCDHPDELDHLQLVATGQVMS